MITLYIDNIFQLFESDGNIHIIGGQSTGDVDENGKDIYEKCIKLIIPKAKIKVMTEELTSAISQIAPELKNTEDENNIIPTSPVNNSQEILGSPLIYKI